jgi:multidomain signaling protein FimX
MEGFGQGRDTEQLVGHLRPDFVKIHGGLMQGLGGRPAEPAAGEAAGGTRQRCGRSTIGERVEDANTMAVLWQLGVEYVQGFFFNAPEAVTIG